MVETKQHLGQNFAKFAKIAFFHMAVQWHSGNIVNSQRGPQCPHAESY